MITWYSFSRSDFLSAAATISEIGKGGREKEREEEREGGRKRGRKRGRDEAKVREEEKVRKQSDF